jgi:hypothetical protein
MVSVLVKLVGETGTPLYFWNYSIHLNLYTIPGYISIITCLLGGGLLLLQFDGTMVGEEKEPENNASPSNSNAMESVAPERSLTDKPDVESTRPIDRLAVISCLLIRAAINFSFVYLIT